MQQALEQQAATEILADCVLCGEQLDCNDGHAHAHERCELKERMWSELPPPGSMDALPSWAGGLNMKQEREPYVYVTGLTKLLTGENSCEWAAWFQAHHRDYEQMPSSLDLVAWRVQHTANLRRKRIRLQDKGYEVEIENQNWFKLPVGGIDLGGKPDIIAIKRKGRGFIGDIKGGKPKESDQVQVMVYMWAVPQAIPKYKGVKFSGRVFYKDDVVIIPAEKITGAFVKELRRLIRRIGGPDQAYRVPSIRECGFCKITKDDCPVRIDKDTKQTGEDDL